MWVLDYPVRPWSALVRYCVFLHLGHSQGSSCVASPFSPIHALQSYLLILPPNPSLTSCVYFYFEMNSVHVCRACNLGVPVYDSVRDTRKGKVRRGQLLLSCSGAKSCSVTLSLVSLLSLLTDFKIVTKSQCQLTPSCSFASQMYVSSSGGIRDTETDSILLR